MAAGAEVMTGTALDVDVPGPPVAPAPTTPHLTLSNEQQAVIDAVVAGNDVIVDASIGSGKTSTIQQLCARLSPSKRILYLTYSRLLKADAQDRVGGARVQNYHGVVYPHLLRLGVNCGVGESVQAFNDHFADIRTEFEQYDLLVVDEYQDINTEYADLLRNIKSTNSGMQVVLVGDLSQKVRSDTTLDVQAFAREFCVDPTMLPFTQSFRMGPMMGSLLGTAWNKPIVGVNDNQRVRVLDHADAIELIAATEPGNLLCLGKRTGAMVHALNEAEKLAPERYNKSTVFASIRDGDSTIRPQDGVAVFTTFDASKGMERPVCVIFDYSLDNWNMRCKFPNTDYEVLRNVFLVAASRGKSDVVFVRSGAMRKNPLPTDPGAEPMIGQLPIRRFTALPSATRPQYTRPFAAASAFGFKYAENIAAAMQLIKRERLDDGTENEIVIDRADGLIDLSPAVGAYQEALFFDHHDATAQAVMMLQTSRLAASLVTEIKGEPWKDSLVLAAIETQQMRYHNQVSATISTEVATALVQRLSQQLPRNCQVQVGLSLAGTARAGSTNWSPITFSGIADAIHHRQIFELKFTSALDHEMFLQTALYVTMARYAGIDIDSGVLWNTRTGERWSVQVPNPASFMNAVVKCVTKQSYRHFDPSGTEQS
ncbi:AAA family ATPase [Rhodococcoides fascians]|uniref:AAA family ATPase n=1 Tax=Rhodococcoides fascians TaxID=1828 RepID=UPI000B0D17E6|nr:AAA family ATPase [Rhodococcus fascians]